ncbi:succinylglutamate desuccinylase/aspartoacylase family protein [Ascidiimonas sp. W6]|uniref:succinylglutamate desuccinylase/aspartoacylase domain-containing protein n=1 Tax=Ascidiimonas meishanensis TaxID=3128903 RepID=UPI0030EB748B
MSEVYSKALHKTIEVNRIIGKISGKNSGPVVIFTGGIHGNESAGVFALQRVLDFLKPQESIFNGSIYALSGNLSALKNGERYNEKDLNRIWTPEYTNLLEQDNFKPSGEDEQEQLELFKAVQHILTVELGPFYFIDLHTTSGKTIPFAILNDSLLNRKFTMQYPIPLVLGIEEYLIGPFLSYINELGYVAFGYESGQHDSKQAIDYHESFIFLTLYFLDIWKNEALFKKHFKRLADAGKGFDKFYEIFYEHKIANNSNFIMKSGFENFQKIQKNQELAIENGIKVPAPRKGRIFMPLYQQMGDDGFFLIRQIPYYFLEISKVLRNLKFDTMLPLLPGVRWQSQKKDTLLVNRKIARFFAKQFFHLMGYRSKTLNKNHLIVKNREAASRNMDYKEASWY